MKIDNHYTVRARRQDMQLLIEVAPFTVNHHKALDLIHTKGPSDWVEAAQVALVNSPQVQRTRQPNGVAIRVMNLDEATAFLDGYVAANKHKDYSQFINENRGEV